MGIFILMLVIIIFFLCELIYFLWEYKKKIKEGFIVEPKNEKKTDSNITKAYNLVFGLLSFFIKTSFYWFQIPVMIFSLSQVNQSLNS